jgi:hypothetical protein
MALRQHTSIEFEFSPMSLQSFLASIRTSLHGSTDPQAEEEGAAILRRLRELRETTTPSIAGSPVAQAELEESKESR